ncbi:MAG: tRNA pseudouridine(55) synthase TruB [Chloroflexota bacterium]
MTLGILNLDKPSGMTSFAVVSRVRHASGVRRVGHAGTLDPLASGVLLVCLGQATRVIPYLQDGSKVYLATIRLGQQTDTYDSEGPIAREGPVPDRLDLDPYIGEIWQTPPLYSALKRGGKPLYAYARSGQTVEIEPRRVRIDGIEVVDWLPPIARLRVTCGKGTYIRSLANDLGGHLTALRRERVGPFGIEDALALDEPASWENGLMPMEAALAMLQRLPVDASLAARVRSGRAVEAPPGEILAVDERGRAVAVLREGRPKIVFGEA